MNDKMQENLGKLVGTLFPSLIKRGTRVGEWYGRNPYHRFDKGDVLVLSGSKNMGHEMIIGYGIRPVAVVDEFVSGKSGEEGHYVLTMHRDESKWGEDWDGERFVTEHEERSKVYTDHDFDRVPVDTAEEALAFYKDPAKELAEFYKRNEANLHSAIKRLRRSERN